MSALGHSPPSQPSLSSRGRLGGKGDILQSLKIHSIFNQTRCRFKSSLVSRGLAGWGRERRGRSGCGRRLRQQLREQRRCCRRREGVGFLPACSALGKNSKANNLNYSPASLGVPDDAFVYLNPNVKAKIVFCLWGHMLYGHWRNKQSA